MIIGPKDKRAFIFYIITTLVLWRFGIVVRDLCIKPDMQFYTMNNPVFSFVYAKNTGGAFSILENMPVFLSAVGIIALLCVLIYVYKRLNFNDKFKILSSVIFSAGILGNVFERITNGYVIDFIKLNFVNFAIFNAFDIMITISVIFFAIYIIFEDIANIYAKKISSAKKVSK